MFLLSNLPHTLRARTVKSLTDLHWIHFLVRFMAESSCLYGVFFKEQLCFEP